MSRRDEVEAEKWTIDRGDLAIGRFRLQCTSPHDIAKWHNEKVRTLAAEVDQRDATITALLEMLRPEPKINYECRFVDFCKHEDRRKLLELLHARALEIAWRTE